MVRIGSVDLRFQSYNVEMIEVTGGRFWKPYGSVGEKPPGLPADVPFGMDSSLYESRPPIDLANPRLRELAAALGPAYVRVSGTWANTTYFYNGDGEPPATPRGFSGVLTRSEWKGVVDFAHAVNAQIVSSFATSPGARDARGVWTSKEANTVIAYTTSVGGLIAAAEFMNEPTFAAMGGAPKGYDATSYGRDIVVFKKFLRRASPKTIFLGPGSVGEGVPLAPAERMLKSEDLLAAAGPVFDVFSYHYYGRVSQRCAKAMPSAGTNEQEALSEEWLSRTDKVEAFYAALRDKFEPRRPLWITETADAACGGNPWASTFLDSFRYLDQLGRLARAGVQVVIHNTLASSDYGLLDEKSFLPRPNYWAAMLWHKLMGITVLDAGPSREGFHIYAQCLRGQPGGVALLAINNSRTQTTTFSVSQPAERYSLTAATLESGIARLNGKELRLQANDALPTLAPVAQSRGDVALAPASITFLAVPAAQNTACR